MMTPDEAEAHAVSAKRQFENLGRDSHIDPAQIRADAEVKYQAFQQKKSAPATKGDIDALNERIKVLTHLVLNLDRRPVNVTYAGVDAIGRTAYQATKAASKALACAR